MDALILFFAVSSALALAFLLWLYSKPGKKWLQEIH